MKVINLLTLLSQMPAEADVVVKDDGGRRQRLEKRVHEVGVALEKSPVPDVILPK